MDRCEQLIERLRAQGERMTIPRRLVIQAICAQSGHATIRDLAAHLNASSAAGQLSETTIYRILQWLRDLGAISQTDMGDVGIVYEVLDAPHHHLICLTCGTVLALDDSYFAALRARLHHEHGFNTRIDHMAIYGYCRVCSAKMPDRT